MLFSLSVSTAHFNIIAMAINHNGRISSAPCYGHHHQVIKSKGKLLFLWNMYGWRNKGLTTTQFAIRSREFSHLIICSKSKFGDPETNLNFLGLWGSLCTRSGLVLDCIIIFLHPSSACYNNNKKPNPKIRG